MGLPGNKPVRQAGQQVRRIYRSKVSLDDRDACCYAGRARQIPCLKDKSPNPACASRDLPHKPNRRTGPLNARAKRPLQLSHRAENPVTVTVVDGVPIPIPGCLTDYSCDPFLHVVVAGCGRLAGAGRATSGMLRGALLESVRFLTGKRFMGRGVKSGAA